MGQATATPTEPAGSGRQLVFELPQLIPITDAELCALEVLLGGSLRVLLAEAGNKNERSRR